MQGGPQSSDRVRHDPRRVRNLPVLHESPTATEGRRKEVFGGEDEAVVNDQRRSQETISAPTLGETAKVKLIRMGKTSSANRPVTIFRRPTL